MATYDVLVRIEEEHAGDALASIASMYAGASPVPISDRSNLYAFRVSAHTTVNAIAACLSGIGGVGVASIAPRKSARIARLTRRGRWVCVAAAWASLYAASVAVPDNPVEEMSKLQEILVHSAIAIAVAAWAYHSGKKSGRHLAKSASSSELGAWEASELARRAARRPDQGGS